MSKQVKPKVKKRRAYPFEFKLRAVRLLLEEGFSGPEIGRELGCSFHTVYKWAVTNGYSFANEGETGPDETDFAEEEKYRPVTMISWRDAIVWCNAYSQMSNLEPAIFI